MAALGDRSDFQGWSEIRCRQARFRPEGINAAVFSPGGARLQQGQGEQWSFGDRHRDNAAEQDLLDCHQLHQIKKSELVLLMPHDNTINLKIDHRLIAWWPRFQSTSVMKNVRSGLTTLQRFSAFGAGGSADSGWRYFSENSTSSPLKSENELTSRCPASFSDCFTGPNGC